MNNNRIDVSYDTDFNGLQQLCCKVVQDGCDDDLVFNVTTNTYLSIYKQFEKNVNYNNSTGYQNIVFHGPNGINIILVSSELIAINQFNNDLKELLK